MLNLACTAMLDIGDEVLVPDPGWANYVGLMMQVGAVPVPVRLKEENGFMYDVADLRGTDAQDKGDPAQLPLQPHRRRGKCREPAAAGGLRQKEKRPLHPHR